MSSAQQSTYIRQDCVSNNEDSSTTNESADLLFTTSTSNVDEKNSSSDEESCFIIFEDDDDGSEYHEYWSSKQNQFIIDRKNDNPTTSSEKCQLCMFCDVYDAERLSGSVENKDESREKHDAAVKKAKKCPGCRRFGIGKKEKNYKLYTLSHNMNISQRVKKGCPEVNLCFGCALFIDISDEEDSSEENLCCDTNTSNDEEQNSSWSEPLSTIYEEIVKLGENDLEKSLTARQEEFIRDRKNDELDDNSETSTEKCQFCMVCDVFDPKRIIKSIQNQDGLKNESDMVLTTLNKCPGCEYFKIGEQDEKHIDYYSNLFLRSNYRRKNNDSSVIKLCFGCAYFDRENDYVESIEEPVNSITDTKNDDEKNSSSDEESCFIIFEDDDDGSEYHEYWSSKQNQFIIDRKNGKIKDNPTTSSEKCQLCMFCDVYDAERLSGSVENKDESREKHDAAVKKAKKCPGCRRFGIGKKEKNYKLYTLSHNMNISQRVKKGCPEVNLCFGCALFIDISDDEDSSDDEKL